MTSAMLLWSAISSIGTTLKHMEELSRLEELDPITRESVLREIVSVRNCCTRLKEIESWSQYGFHQQ